MTSSPRQQPRHPEPPALADGFERHSTREPITAKGVVIPGLRATFYRRRVGTRTQTIGSYTLDARELFVAWGYADEPHCRFNAVHRHNGGWHPTRRGCPVLHPMRERDQVTGLRILAGHRLLPFRTAHPLNW